jgi:hypothetical protein
MLFTKQRAVERRLLIQLKEPPEAFHKILISTFNDTI